MKKLIDCIFKQLKTQPDVWFFFLFLLTFSLNVRKVMLYFPVKRTFNEYTGIYIYLSEIFLILAIGLWLFALLSSNLTKLSNYFSQSVIKHGLKAYIKQNTAINKLRINKVIHNLSWIFPLVFVAWSFISLLWSQNQMIATFRSIKLLELYGLYLYLVYRVIPLYFNWSSNNRQNVEDSGGEMSGHKSLENVSPHKIQKCSTPASTRGRRSSTRGGWNNSWTAFGIIMFVVLFQSVVAVLQFILQHSVGFRFLRESIINPDIPGVAKIILDGDRYIRAYGLMPHPNVLGGFLVFSIIITWLYYKLAYFVSYETNCSTWNNFKTKLGWGQETANTFKNHYILTKMWFFEKKWLFKAIIAVQILALLLTFSKSAVLALLIGFVYIFWRLKVVSMISHKNTKCFTPVTFQINVPRGTIHVPKGELKNSVGQLKINIGDMFKLFHVEQFRIIVLSSFIVLVSLFLFLKPDINSIFFQSLGERSLYLNVSYETILANPIMGVGLGQFVFGMQHSFENVLLVWQYQPVHNVFLLIWAEIGLVGLGLFLGWTGVIFDSSRLNKSNIVSRGTTRPVPKKCLNNDGICNNREDSNGKNGRVKSGRDEYILNNNKIELSRKMILVCLRGIFLSFLFIMLFDHYFWDIWQGQVLFWLTAGMIAGCKRCEWHQ